jgi:hypothetical protein
MTDRFAGTGPSPVSAGSDLKVEFSNPDLADTTVTVEATNGQGQTEKIEIKLDSTGKGSTKWKVPATGWGIVRLSQDTSEDHTVAVAMGGGGDSNESAAASENRAANAAGDAFLRATEALESLQRMRQRRDRAAKDAAAYLQRLGALLRK